MTTSEIIQDAEKIGIKISEVYKHKEKNCFCKMSGHSWTEYTNKKLIGYEVTGGKPYVEDTIGFFRTEHKTLKCAEKEVILRYEITKKARTLDQIYAGIPDSHPLKKLWNEEKQNVNLDQHSPIKEI